jgi:hypothetical protein
MKKILLVLALLTISTNTFSANVYCPQSFTCTAQGCGLPENFYISSGNPVLNVTYYFQEATASPGLQIKTPCTYVTNTEKQSQLGLGSRQNIQADTRLSGNHWVPTGGGLLLCMLNANNCPFYYS